MTPAFQPPTAGFMMSRAIFMPSAPDNMVSAASFMVFAAILTRIEKPNQDRLEPG